MSGKPWRYLSIEVGQYAYRGWRHLWGFGVGFERWTLGPSPGMWHAEWTLNLGPVAVKLMEFMPDKGE
jgi:hypothetical protein